MFQYYRFAVTAPRGDQPVRPTETIPACTCPARVFARTLANGCCVQVLRDLQRWFDTLVAEGNHRTRNPSSAISGARVHSIFIVEFCFIQIALLYEFIISTDENDAAKRLNALISRERKYISVRCACVYIIARYLKRVHRT